jgi:N-acetylneuraminic acid mutarotase
MKKNIIKIFILTVFTSVFSFGQSWEVIGEMPEPVAGGAIVVKDSKIYILGGYSDFTQRPVDYIQMYDPYTSEWQQIGSMKEARYGLSAGVINDNIFYYGGIRDSSDYIEYLEVFSPLDTNSPYLSKSHEAFNRSFSSSVVKDNSLFVFGGEPFFEVDSVELPYLSIFNLDSFDDPQNYDTLFSPKEPAHHQMATRVEDKVYIFGGVSNSIENRIYTYDFNTTKFERSSFDMILPRASGSAVYLPFTNEIFLIGGLDEVEPALSNVEVYSLDQETSAVFPSYSLNIPRSELMAVEFDNLIYVFGGKDDQGIVVNSIEIFDPQAVTIQEESQPVTDYQLDQNYPNPFNPITNIRFSIKENDFVRLKIFNILGQEIAALAGDHLNAGMHNYTWNGTDNNGEKVGSGNYFYRLETSEYSITKKMTLLN